MKKKMSEKKRASAGEAGWDIAHFKFALGHDTTNCIVTQGLEGAQGRLVARHDMAW